MLKAARIGLRLAPLVAVVYALCVLCGVPVAHRERYSPAPITVRPTFDSRALAAALPSVLSPPVLQPGSRLVSMIAEDIDADGDLDVVASDGSLNLIVWTNDGSGRLSRQPGREADGGMRSEPGAPGVTGDSAERDTAVPSACGSFAIDTRALSIAEARTPLLRRHAADRLSSAFVSTRTPRGPPVPDSRS